MSALLATIERELRAYFFSPLAYVILACFLLINGGVFSLIVSYLSNPQAGGSTTPMKLFFGDTFFFWLVLLFVVPVLTMRLIAEERKSGTIEMLMTSPITDAQVVVGKYLASFLFYVFLWLPTLAYVAILARSSEVDWGPIASGYIGLLMIGAVFLAVGIFGSCFAKNQIVAAIVTFAFLMFFFAIALVDGLVTSETWKNAIGYINLLSHMDEFGRGVVDSRRLIYYISTVALFLFLSTRALEARKWR